MQFLVVLVVSALVVKFWPVLVGGIGMIVAVSWGRRVADRHAERIEAERRRLAGLMGRADAQHNWTLQGDDRGLYDEYPPVAV